MNDGYVDEELKVSPRKQCPAYCSIFGCIIEEKNNGKCREECGKLDLTNSLICVLCEEKCDKERKITLLDTKYFDHMKTLKTDDTSKKLDGIKDKYRSMELVLEQIRDEYHKTASWRYFAKGQLEERSAKLRAKMETYSDMMEDMGIQYDKKVEL